MRNKKLFLTPVILGVVLFFSLSFFTGCSIEKSVDYSAYPFVDVSWTRNAEHDIETIRFNSNGSFVYSCACGNPVNDSDLCEGYSYDDTTKTITLNYTELTEEAVTRLKIIECDENSLHLDFEGEIRIFEK